MNRFLFLDSLRGVAAFAVLLFHYTAVYRSLYGHNFSESFDFSFGLYGVELFFMISGFVIFFSFKKITNGQQFLFNRVARLYPAYWFCLLVTFFFVQYFGLHGLETSFTDMLINLTMFQKVARVPDVDGVYWSLFSEWMFYLMVLVLFITKKLDKILYVGAVWIVLNFVHIHLFHFGFAGRMLNLIHGVFFYSGILFYLLKTQPENKKVILAHLAASFIIAVSLYIPDGLGFAAIIAGIYAVFYLGLSGKLDFIVNKVFLFLGSISYALYLFHQNIGYIIINQTKEFFGDSILVIVPPTVISIICAYLITIYVEKPTVRLMKNWYDSRTGETLKEDKKVVTSGFTKREAIAKPVE
jgi:peptidoglycan/LPS O-acetylase OafA/YrhL